jgi:cell division protein FtsL
MPRAQGAAQTVAARVPRGRSLGAGTPRPRAVPSRRSDPARAARGRPRGSQRPIALRSRAEALLDGLLRGQAWIALVSVLLVGIVFFNVDLLQRGRDIARTGERSVALKRENARLRLELARLGSSERIQRAAAGRGLLLPAPGEVRYLRANPAVDGRRAAARIREEGGPGAAEAPALGAP